MFVSSSRPTASRFASRIACASVVCGGLLGFSAARALAAGVPAKTAVCEGQIFAQPFGAFKDSNYYTFVPGSDFKGPSQGWELSKGAQIIQTTGPAGGALDLPSGAVAVSPPVCVTLLYPTARVWVRNVKGGEDVSVGVGVAYANTKTATNPKNVGQVHGQQNSWTLSEPFNVQPQIAGSVEETREVRFVFVAGGRTSDFQLSGLYVDPRMRR